jgi:hypothetical protein
MRAGLSQRRSGVGAVHPGIDPGEDVVCSSADGMVIKRVTADRKLMSVNPALPYGDKMKMKSRPCQLAE